MQRKERLLTSASKQLEEKEEALRHATFSLEQITQQLSKQTKTNKGLKSEAASLKAEVEALVHRNRENEEEVKQVRRFEPAATVTFPVTFHL